MHEIRRCARIGPRAPRGRDRHARDGDRPGRTAARASRRPLADHLRTARRTVHDRRRRDVRGRGPGPAAAGERRDRGDGRAARRRAWERDPAARRDAPPPRVHQRRPGQRPRRPRVPVLQQPRALLRHQRGTAAAHAPARLRLPDERGRPVARAADGDASPRRRTQVLPGVPRDRRPAAGDPGDAVLAERDSVCRRPPVVGPRKRHRPAPAHPRVHAARGRPDRRRRRPPARRRARARTEPAGLQAHTRPFQAGLRAEGRPAVRRQAAAPRTRSERGQLVAVGDRLADPRRRAAEDDRGLRRHAPAHARDGDRARLHRARARRRLAARPRRATRRRSARASRARAGRRRTCSSRSPG